MASGLVLSSGSRGEPRGLQTSGDTQLPLEAQGTTLLLVSGEAALRWVGTRCSPLFLL